MTNYIDEYDVNTLEEPDWPETNYDSLAPPDDIPYIGDPPEWPDDFISSEPHGDLDEPPLDYAPPDWLVNLSPEVLEAAFDPAPSNPDMSTEELMKAAGYDLDELDRDNPYFRVDPVEQEVEIPLEPEYQRPLTAAEQKLAAGLDTSNPEIQAQLEREQEALRLYHQEYLQIHEEMGINLFAPEEPEQVVTVDTTEQELDRPLTPDEAEKMLGDIEMRVIGFNPDGSPRDDLWNNYVESVVEGTNLGGPEAELIERAEAINLQDAGFVTYSNEQGHFVSAIEVAADPASGDRYGLVLDVARFDAPKAAVSLYNELQEHVLDNTLPNYAVVDYASHVAVEMGNDPGDLNWRDATEQDLFVFDMNHPWQQGLEHETSLDEPPAEIWNELIQEQLGIDLAQYANEGQNIEYERDPDQADLQYNLYLNDDREGNTLLSIAKEWDGGIHWGGGEDVRQIGLYETPGLAQSVAQDLWMLRKDVEELVGDTVAGQQAMASMAYEIGLANGTIEQGEPLFKNESGRAPDDPFEIYPTEQLFAEYETLRLEQEGQDIELDKVGGGPDFDL